MNIIQLQDRLKGVSDQALVGYVENPTGDVPTYLALGELQRRKTMRERYEAQKEPTSTVAEQLVAESGVGALVSPQGMTTEGMGAEGIKRTLPPSVPYNEGMDSTLSGLGALPADNVGNYYAGGGIVAFADGGQLPTLGVPNPAFGLLSPEEVVAKQAEEEKALVTKQIEDQAKAEMEMHKQKRLEREAAEKAKQPEQAAETIAPVEQATPMKSMQDYVKEFQAMMGEDEYRKRLDERMTEMDERLAKQRDTAPWMALTEAGLAMAAGESPDAITNIAKGATQGLKSYTEEIKNMQTLEQKRLENLDALAKADRAEKLAAVKYGMDSEQFKIAEQNKIDIANQKAVIEGIKIEQKERLETAKMLKDLQIQGSKEKKIAAETRQWVIENMLDDFNSKVEARDGSRYIGSPQYELEKENFIKEQVMLQMRELEAPSVNTAGFSVVR